MKLKTFRKTYGEMKLCRRCDRTTPVGVPYCRECRQWFIVERYAIRFSETRGNSQITFEEKPDAEAGEGA